MTLVKLACRLDDNIDQALVSLNLKYFYKCQFIRCIGFFCVHNEPLSTDGNIHVEASLVNITLQDSQLWIICTVISEILKHTVNFNLTTIDNNYNEEPLVCFWKLKFLKYIIIQGAENQMDMELILIGIYKGFRTSKRRLRLGHHRRKYRSTPSYGTVTGLLTAVSITFLCLHTPIHIFKLKVIIETISTKYAMKVNPTERTIGNVFQVMYYLNASVNILVYYVCGGNFRKVFKQVLCKDVSCCCHSKHEEDMILDAVTTELTSILDKGDG
ncbi:OPRK1 [Mytilus coruscus]|uniref:OPRK1 n=1 Tax=Mytilus coruscus TaxID=42192 RepID=A0A6J8DA39_MYTCO|nr:OPRK1 [Mytilus coruscus]